MFNIIAMLLAVDVSILAISGFSLWAMHFPRLRISFPMLWLSHVIGYSRLKMVHKIAGIILVILVLLHVGL